MHTFKKCHIAAGCLFSALLITFVSHAYAAADATAGKTAAAGGDFALAEKEWRAAAKAGNADAQYHLGALLITDKLGAPKVEEGVQWWRQAALQGHADAANTLGLIYFTGVGAVIKKDLPRAARAFELAAQKGHPAAQVSLAMMLMDGQGIAVDRKAAMNWMEKAAQQGNARAQFSLGSFYADGRAGEKNMKLANEWIFKAAESGFASAQLSFSRMRLNGEHSAGEAPKARTWFEKAANQGVPEAA